ncbi:TPA: 4-demethylwyosine synthase TYW1 [Candidatus Woesearchaeota archaeon]|nr:4-demethylwyosine synthase TYW1 [Candidatus Woesearchaeota archaeon]HII68487.1 4-demethylwyosine synthase TYW1 [Candidatus Woesearchaeota archaeon]
MLTESARASLEKQKYRVIGSHSAVKTCGWTNKMIKGEGGCYKLKFYGIMSNQCMQMTTSISCANRCTFCWRGYKAPVSHEWKWKVDEPEMILTESLAAHRKLLNGMGGHPQKNSTAYEASKTVRHVALSLTGEPIIYPKMNNLLGLFNQRSISTFLVTNAQYPLQIRDLNPVTQLYISLDGPNKTSLKKIDLPLFDDYWERLNESLLYLSQKNHRTCIRLTMIKGVNMEGHDEYAGMIQKGDPDFIEIKAYMLLGASKRFYTIDNMPLHEEVVAFTRELMRYLPGYEIVTDHVPSRVVMCAKRSFKKGGSWRSWIDFSRYHELVCSGGPFDAMDYSKKSPYVGLSGKTTADYASLPTKKAKPAGPFIFVNETDEELDFHKGGESNASLRY